MKNEHMEERNGLKNQEIWVHEFTELSARRFREQVIEATQELEKPIIINIDSYGGYVDSLASMIETMNEIRLTHKFITVCRGKAVSCGAILLALGDVRYCGEMSRTMIHNVSSASWGDAYELKSGSEETMRLNKKFMGLLADCCDTTYEAMQEKIRATTNGKEIWMDAKESMDFKLVDQVGLPILQGEVQYAVHTMTTSTQPEEAEKKKVKKKAGKKSRKKAKVTTPRPSSPLKPSKPKK